MNANTRFLAFFRPVPSSPWQRVEDLALNEVQNPEYLMKALVSGYAMRGWPSTAQWRLEHAKSRIPIVEGSSNVSCSSWHFGWFDKVAAAEAKKLPGDQLNLASRDYAVNEMIAWQARADGMAAKAPIVPGGFTAKAGKKPA